MNIFKKYIKLEKKVKKQKRLLKENNNLLIERFKELDIVLAGTDFAEIETIRIKYNLRKDLSTLITFGTALEDKSNPVKMEGIYPQMEVGDIATVSNGEVTVENNKGKPEDDLPF